MTLDAEPGNHTPPRVGEQLHAIGTVFVSINGSEIMIELGSAKLPMNVVAIAAAGGEFKTTTTLPGIAAVLREVAEKLDGSSITPAPELRGRHFAPYGSFNALCGEPVGSAPDMTTGEYSDDRYTVYRGRTTCPDCLALMDPTEREGER